MGKGESRLGEGHVGREPISYRPTHSQSKALSGTRALARPASAIAAAAAHRPLPPQAAPSSMDVSGVQVTSSPLDITSPTVPATCVCACVGVCVCGGGGAWVKGGTTGLVITPSVSREAAAAAEERYSSGSAHPAAARGHQAATLLPPPLRLGAAPAAAGAGAGPAVGATSRRSALAAAYGGQGPCRCTHDARCRHFKCNVVRVAPMLESLVGAL